MTSTFKTLGAALCVAAVSFSATSNAQNLLVDPGFELQTPVASGGWTVQGGAGFSTAQARTGTSSMFDNSVNGNFGIPLSFETFATTPGSQFDLTGFGFVSTAPAAGANFGILQITFFSGANGTGNNLGSIDVSTGGTATGAGNAQTSSQINNASPVGQWIFLDTGIAQAPAGAQSLEAFTLVVDANPVGVYFDDINLSAVVPEPSTLALLGLSLLGIPALRRRK